MCAAGPRTVFNATGTGADEIPAPDLQTGAEETDLNAAAGNRPPRRPQQPVLGPGAKLFYKNFVPNCAITSECRILRFASWGWSAMERVLGAFQYQVLGAVQARVAVERVFDLIISAETPAHVGRSGARMK